MLHTLATNVKTWIKRTFPTTEEAWSSIALMREDLADSARLIERNIYLSDTPQQLHNMQRMIDNLPRLYGRNAMVASWQDSLQRDLHHRFKAIGA